MLSRANRKMFELIARAIIQNQNHEILLVKRTKKPAQGKWILPGGKVEFHEKAETCISREIKEELNMEFAPKFLDYREDFASVPERHCMVLYFMGEVKGKMIIKRDEIAEARYFTIEELIDSDEIGFDHKDTLQTFSVTQK